MEAAARIALELPEVSEGRRYGNRAWSVHDKVFAWQRPFSKADLKRFGDVAPPAGPIIAVSVADLNEKDAVIAEHPEAFFTIAHFDGYPAVLVDLDHVTTTLLREVITDAWSDHVPESLAREHRRRR
jgi:hypothetical protein